MSIPLETLIGWGATAATIAGHAFVVSYRVSQSERQLEKLWDWKDGHDKDTGEKRLEIQKQFGSMEGRISGHDSNYAEILRLLGAMNDKFDKLETRLESYRNTRKEEMK